MLYKYVIDEILDNGIQKCHLEPVKTNAQKFEEVFGPVCKCPMSTTNSSISTAKSYTNVEIRKYLAIDEDWWKQEYKEPKK